MMSKQVWVLAGLLATATLGSGVEAGRSSASLTLDGVNRAELKGRAPAGPQVSPVVVKAQVLLDRAFFSPGVIDGHTGGNFNKALKTFQAAKGLTPSGSLDSATWAALSKGASEPVLTRHSITAEEVKGPFAKKIPSDPKQMAKLKQLAYTSAAEMFAERFHMDVDLLKKLNPGVDFKKAGGAIVVANVLGKKPAGEVAKIVVEKKSQTLRALDKQGKLVAFYPATVGSGEFPSPTGNLKVVGVAERPTFTLTGKIQYFKKKLNKGEIIKVAPGPNNPVGAVWIDLNKDGYGIHGTPEPALVSKRASHGCVRLTNWDAAELAKLVKPGVPVSFSATPSTVAAR